MKGVSFGDFHSYRDFSLILSQKTIGTPSPKTEAIDIPGGDGVLDLTEFFGEVKYNNRNQKAVGKLTIDCDCEPYKYRLAETVVAVVVNGTNSVVLPNGRKRVVPEITTDAEMKITFGAYTGTFDAGTFTIPELVLAAGRNTVKVTGAGNISFRYREGVL